MRGAGSRAVIDLDAYAHNLMVVRNLIPRSTRILAVVKANAYGHGAVAVARRAVAEGVAMLGVATVEEALELRRADIEAPIVVLLQPPPASLAAAIEHDLRLTVSDIYSSERIGDLARRAGKVAPIHCKVDSGMGRQGFGMSEAVDGLLFLTRISHIDIEAVWTHFPIAETAKDPFTANQTKQFKQLLRKIEKEGIPFEMAHAANSAAIVNFPAAAFDMVRPGLMTYGVWPCEQPPEDVRLEPVLRWETQIVLIKELSAGATVGYGRTYKAGQTMRTAVLPVGYADGYKYGLSNKGEAVIHGKRCPIRGNISMDQIVVDVTHLPEASLGDTATLVGEDGGERITVEEVAHKAGTIPYDILTGIGRRVARVYRNE